MKHEFEIGTWRVLKVTMPPVNTNYWGRIEKHFLTSLAAYIQHIILKDNNY